MWNTYNSPRQKQFEEKSHSNEHSSVREIIRKANNAFGLMRWKEAFDLYKSVENQTKNPHIYYRLGAMYTKGYGTELDSEKADMYFSWALQKIPVLAILHNDPEAQYDLGCCYSNGYGVVKDKQLAAYYFKHSADQGYVSAQYNLGCMFDDEGEGVEVNKATAINYYLLAAEQGHISAQFNLVCTYHNADGVDKDMQMAAKYYKLAADQGHPSAQFNLGIMYAGGEGVPRDIAMAEKYYQLAASSGFADAMYTLSCMYESGTGVPRNYRMALRYCVELASTKNTTTHVLKKAQKHLVDIFLGVKGKEIQYVATEYLLAERWPKSHTALNSNCKHVVMELFMVMQCLPWLSLPIEIIVLVLREVIVVWPDNHYVTDETFSDRSVCSDICK